ncbi:MAG: hypothetical protein CMO47_06360 [Verrucomicrobiales bacterium]|jgi:rhodanese-related sulfurtransferase|nr:hypothetical protein [Verrucomicrobiales bacterium]|tara:strand:+ start:1176 stop:1634 length:459 start_codon:yes stop_codon:yes gene_type:complete
MKSTLRQGSLILAISLAASALSFVFHPMRPPWYRVASPDELRWQIDLPAAAALVQEGEVLWVDARSREKYEASHLEDAILLNAGEWADLMFQNLDILQDAMDKTVVVYCDSGECQKSNNVASRLRELVGLDPVYVLKGEWTEMKSLISGSGK